MFEYVISAGEGTLIELGVWRDYDDLGQLAMQLDADHTLTLEACAQDCETGL